MKRIHTISKFAAIVLITSLLFACKKDKKTDSVTTTSDYINVENGTFVNSGLPNESGSNVDATITANSKALEGGSTPINVHTQSAVSHLLLGIKGSSGYYQTSVSDLQRTSDGYAAVILFNDNMPTKEFTIEAEMMNDATGDVGGKTEIKVSTLDQSAAAKLQISLSWDLLNDIDLHVVEPDSNEIYYLNPGYISYDYQQLMADHPNDFLYLTPADKSKYIVDDSLTTGVLDLDSNAGCSIDSVNNENIIYIFPSDIKTGEYTVRIDFYSDCVGGNLPTNYIVTARYDNQLITPTSGSNPYNGSFEPGTDDFGAQGAGVEVMKFNISQVKSTRSTKQHIYLERSKKKTINLDKLQEHLEHEYNNK